MKEKKEAKRETRQTIQVMNNRMHSWAFGIASKLGASNNRGLKVFTGPK